MNEKLAEGWRQVYKSSRPRDELIPVAYLWRGYRINRMPNNGELLSGEPQWFVTEDPDRMVRPLFHAATIEECMRAIDTIRRGL